MDMFLNDRSVSSVVFEQIYFNPKIPENYSIKLVDFQNRKITVYQDDWKTFRGKEMTEIINSIHDIMRYFQDCFMSNPTKSPFGGVAGMSKLSLDLQEKFGRFSDTKPMLTEDDIREVFLLKNHIVHQALKNNEQYAHNEHNEHNEQKIPVLGKLINLIDL
jgi:hypothetical protein